MSVVSGARTAGAGGVATASGAVSASGDVDASAGFFSAAVVVLTFFVVAPLICYFLSHQMLRFLARLGWWAGKCSVNLTATLLKELIRGIVFYVVFMRILKQVSIDERL